MNLALVKRIHLAIAAIPEGSVAAYGQIAKQAGLPGRARLVARVLSQVESPPSLPWHRVVRADGRLGLPAGSNGANEQIRRLADEGVAVKHHRVGRSYQQQAPDLDALIWAPRLDD